MNFLNSLSLSRQDSTGPQFAKRQHLPWIQSPLVDEDPVSESSTSILHGVPDGKPQRDPDVPHFRHPESNTIEILYDLFFVANLSNFNALHGVENRASLQNFVGFYTILWFTYLQTTIRDVRFGADSVFDRVCKAITFGVMAGFALSGALFDVTDVQKNAKGFRLLFLTLMVSRLTLMVQYGVVLYYVRGYQRTFVPLVFTMLLLAISAAVFLGIFFAHYGGVSQNGHIAAYTVSVVEAVGMLAISCIYRVVSFRKTRFADRLGDLTLIMLGEGILGLVISISKIMQNSAHISGSVGVTAAGVLMIYFIWMLYFDQIEHQRFGTIRQQIWAILHYPLNLAILLIVEGNKELISYNTIVSVDERWLEWYQGDYHSELIWDDFSEFSTATELSQYFRDAVDDLGTIINNNKLASTFNVSMIFEALEEIPDEWTEPVWADNVTEFATGAAVVLFQGVENYILQHFGVTAPQENLTDSLTAEFGSMTSAESDFASILFQGSSLWNVVETVFIFFPIAAGSFLLLLALMYCFGKRNKSTGEWWSIALRTVMGLILCVGYTLSLYYVDVDWHLKDSAFPTSVVTLAFFIVIIGDNMFIWWGNRDYEERGLVQRIMEQRIKEDSSYRSVPSRGEAADVEMMKLQSTSWK